MTNLDEMSELLEELAAILSSLYSLELLKNPTIERFHIACELCAVLDGKIQFGLSIHPDHIELQQLHRTAQRMRATIHQARDHLRPIVMPASRTLH